MLSLKLVTLAKFFFLDAGVPLCTARHSTHCTSPVITDAVIHLRVEVPSVQITYRGRPRGVTHNFYKDIDKLCLIIVVGICLREQCVMMATKKSAVALAEPKFIENTQRQVCTSLSVDDEHKVGFCGLTGIMQ